MKDYDDRDMIIKEKFGGFPARLGLAGDENVRSSRIIPKIES